MGDQAYRQRHKAAGLCISCPREAVRGNVCVVHLFKGKVRNRDYYRRNVERFHDRMQKLRDQYRLTGRCSICSAPLTDDDIQEGRKSCLNCIQHIKMPIGANPYRGVHFATHNEGGPKRLQPFPV